MKKIISITIVCLLIPCFGFTQEYDNDFSIEGTLWRVRGIGVTVTATDPPNVEVLPSVTGMLGFSDGKMYMCTDFDGDTCTPDMELPNAHYINRPVISLAYVNITPENAPQSNWRLVATMLPIGVGYITHTERNWGHDPGSVFSHGSGFMVKVSDDWIP